MKKYVTLPLTFVLVLFLFIGSTSGSTSAMKTSTDKLILGFYPVYHAYDQNAYKALSANSAYLNEIATITFQIDAKGQIIGQVPTDGVALANRHKVTALASITNLTDSGFDSALAHQVLSDAKLRTAAVQNITKLLQKNQYGGVTIDFENMLASDRTNFTLFMQELAATLRPLGLQTSVCVMAKTADYASSAWVGAFDYKALGKAVDTIQIMTYDQHGPWDTPGPVAGLNWIESVLTYALGQIPAEKLMLGIPAYGYDWNTSTNLGNDAVTWKAIPQLINSTKAVPKWDNASQSPYFTYKAKDGSNHVIWYEDSRSIQLKTQLVDKYKLAGVFMWRLGFDDEEFWKAVHSGLTENLPTEQTLKQTTTQQMSIQLSGNVPVVQLKKTIPVTFHIVDAQNKPLKGAKVSVTILRPNGKTTKYSGSSNSKGNKLVSITNPVQNPLGIYQVTATAKLEGFSDSTTQFTYQLTK